MAIFRIPSLIAAAFATVTLAAAPPAAAQQSQGDSVKGDGKGIVGGALLGGEIVMIPMAAFGVERAWPYLVFGGLGAVGGGVGGFFIEDNTTHAEVPLYMLAGGMALVIPTLVAVLNSTSYEPPDTDTKEQPAPTTQPAPAGGASVKVSASRARRTASASASLVSVRSTEVGIGVPAVEVRPLYTRREQAVFGVAQGEEVRVPVLKAQF